jgi:hypothetical protein
MQIEHVLDNHKRITERLGNLIDETAQMMPTAMTPFLLHGFQMEIDLLRSLGVRLKTVAELETKLAACKAEIGKESATKPDADGWIPHVPGDPMPVDGATLVYVTFGAPEGRWPHVHRADFWQTPSQMWSDAGLPEEDQIIAYKLA